MDISKARKFNEKMGKRQKFSKGGLIKRIGNRQYFAEGEMVQAPGTTLGGPGTSNGGVAQATVNNNGLTGTIGNALGLNNQFQANSANIQAGTNAAQLNQAYTGAQSGLAQQQNLANQVQPGTTQGLATQNALTGQLEGVANGTGPNAAQAALNENTARNVAAQGALMAGQRGAGANVGLMARQAAQQGAATQQQAVGQGATLQAQQAIAAQQQLANLAQTQVGQGAQAVQGVNSTQQNEQNILQGANTANNNANVAMQGNINNVNAGVAAGNQQMAGNIVNGIGGILSNVPVIGALFAQGGEVGHHCAGAHCTDRQHSMHMMSDGGALQVGPPPAAVGGVGPWLQSNVTTGGPSMDNSSVAAPNVSNPFQNIENKNSAGGGNSGISSLASLAPLAMMALAKGGSVSPGPHNSHVANFLFAEGGEVPAMVSPGERYLNPDEVKRVVEQGENPLKIGRKFPGKPKVKKDSLKNDILPETLEEGGVVLPLHIENKNNRDHAELFVRRAVHMRSPKGGK